MKASITLLSLSKFRLPVIGMSHAAYDNRRRASESSYRLKDKKKAGVIGAKALGEEQSSGSCRGNSTSHSAHPTQRPLKLPNYRLHNYQFPMIPLRDDQPTFSTPFVNYFLIVLNVVVFFWELSVGMQSHRALNSVMVEFGVVPRHTLAVLTGHSYDGLATAILPLFTSIRTPLGHRRRA